MTRLVYGKIYGLPLHRVMLYMGCFVLMWLFGAYISQKRRVYKHIWKGINIAGFAGIVMVILTITIFSRQESYDLVLIPFYSFVEAKIQPEMYRSMMMNVFLFFPLGLTLPYVLPQKCKKQVLFAILFGLLLSAGIEFSQFYFHLGRAEVDDVICNTLGCVIGTMGYRRAGNGKVNFFANI